MDATKIVASFLIYLFEFENVVINRLVLIEY